MKKLGQIIMIMAMITGAIVTYAVAEDTDDGDGRNPRQFIKNTAVQHNNVYTKDWFFDVAPDGEMTKEQFEEQLRGKKEHYMWEERFNAADKNGDGVISYEEEAIGRKKEERAIAKKKIKDRMNGDDDEVDDVADGGRLNRRPQVKEWVDNNPGAAKKVGHEIKEHPKAARDVGRAMKNHPKAANRALHKANQNRGKTKKVYRKIEDGHYRDARRKTKKAWGNRKRNRQGNPTVNFGPNSDRVKTQRRPAQKNVGATKRK